MPIDDMRAEVRAIARLHPDREARARRLFLHESSKAFIGERQVEFSIKSETAEFFDVPFSNIAFCGSAQLGFSPVKETEFVRGVSDLDVAIVSADLFQFAWRDVIDSTRAFSDSTKFGRRRAEEIDIFKSQILKRGMIRVEAMPYSDLVGNWISFQDDISRKYSRSVAKISFAVYLSEYAFCWKQDSAIQKIVGF